MSDMNDRGLPAYCYAIAPKTRLPVRIFRGEHAMVHTLRLDNYSTTPRKLVLGTNSSFGTESIKIERGAGWDGLNLTATWHIPGREEPLRVALLDGDAMDVPPEVTKEAKDGVLVLAGLASGVQRASCNVEYLILEQAGVYGGADAEPTPELAAQVLEATMKAKANTEAAAQDASEAKANANKAQQAAENAAADAAKAGPYAEAALAAKEEAEAASDDAQAAARATSASETAAAGSAAQAEAQKTAAAKSASDAQGYMQTASSAATAANESAENAAGSKAAAASSATAAEESKQAAVESEVKAAESEQAAKASEQAAAKSAQAALESKTAAATSEGNAAASAKKAQDVSDSLPADYKTMSGDVDTLKNQMQLAYPDNTAPTDATWSARKTLAVLCDEVTASGNPVELEDVCEVEAVASWEPVQEGSGDPSPDNIRAINGRNKVAVTCCGETVPTKFAPYVGQTNTLTLPETVYGGNVDARTGEGQETWKTVTLDGNSNFTERSGKVMFLYNFCDDWNRDRKYLSSHYSPFMGGWDNIPNQSFQIVDNALGIRDDRFTSLDDFKSYIAAQHAAGTPVQICYKLTAPEAIQATGGAALAPVEGKNTVMTDADTLSVTAKKAPLVRLGELRKEYKATVGELETAQRDIRVLKKLSKGQVWDFEEKTEDAYVRQVPDGAYAAGVQTWGGKTVAWNNYFSFNIVNPDMTVKNNKIVFTNSNPSKSFSAKKLDSAIPVGHKIYRAVQYLQGKTGNCSYTAYGGYYRGDGSNALWSGFFTIPSNSVFDGSQIEAVIESVANPVTDMWIYMPGENAEIIEPVTVEIIFCDLTLMFGTGNEPTTTDDPRIAWIEQYAAAHQEYNAGKLVSAEVNEVQFNGVAVGVVPSAVQELPGYGWSAGTAKNTVERTADGKWQYVQRVGKVELDGTERLNYYDPIERGLVATIICMPEVMSGEAIGLCSLYKFVKNKLWNGEKENCVFFSYDKTLGLSLDLSTATSFGFDGTRGTIPKTLKAMLETYKSRGTPLSITYPLNTPIVTDITDLMGTDALNFEVEPGGSITMHNATELPVPATIQYVEKLSEVVSND